MTIVFIILCLVSSISASTAIPIYSQKTYPQHPKSSDLNVISVDSQTFFDEEHRIIPAGKAVAPSPTTVHHSKSDFRTVIPVDSQMFLDSEAKPSYSDAMTVLPIDSQTFFTGETKPRHVPGFGATIDNHKPSDLTVIPMDSQTFFNSEPKPPHVKAFPVTVKHSKPTGLTAIHIDSQTFFNHKPISPLLDPTVRHPKPSGLTAVHIDSQTFFNHKPISPRLGFSFRHPKSSDVNDIPIDSQTFFTSEPKPPRFDTNIPLSKSSNINVMPVDSQTFFTSEPKPPHLDATATVPKFCGMNVMAVDSQTLFSSEPKPPHHDGSVPFSKSPNNIPIQFDSKIFFKSEPKYKDSASYCSVYLKKENLKKGAIVCPFFAAPSPTQESSVRSICQHQSQEKEFKFCSSSYQDISKKVTDKLGKNRLVSSARREMNISTIAGIKNIAAYGQAVICHRAQYVGFYCHQLGKSSVFALSLSNLNGHHRKYANMFAVCHDDTTSWDHNRQVFKILNSKPGDAICHLLPSYDLVWVALR